MMTILLRYHFITFRGQKCRQKVHRLSDINVPNMPKTHIEQYVLSFL